MKIFYFMLNLKTFLHVLATVLKNIKCSILHFEMYKNWSHNFIYILFIQRKKNKQTKQNCFQSLIYNVPVWRWNSGANFMQPTLISDPSCYL